MIRNGSIVESTILIILFAACSAIFFAQRYTQLCVKSERTSIQSMCILCDSKQFRTMSYICTGQHVVPSNTTQEQAFCLISTCLRQVPGQQGTPIGRRKRGTHFGDNLSKTVEIFVESDYEDRTL